MERYNEFVKKYTTLPEDEILKDESFLSCLGSSLYLRQFSLDFLAKTSEWYDSWLCLRSQKGLTPEFCFRYLYDNGTDSADDWTDYNDIKKYFDREGTHSEEQIEAAFKAELEHRRNKVYEANPDK
jgi:hypothetical protein